MKPFIHIIRNVLNINTKVLFADDYKMLYLRSRIMNDIFGYYIFN